MCRPVWGGLRGSLSLMYSSMHPLRGCVNRVERTLVNFFSRRCVRGGFFRVLGQCFTGKIGAAARREWAVLPRNSGFLGGARVRRGDSAHGGHERANWAKNFLKIFKNVRKTQKLGCERGRKVV